MQNVPFATQRYKPYKPLKSLVTMHPLKLRKPYLPSRRDYDIVGGRNYAQSTTSLPKSTRSADVQPYPICRRYMGKKKPDFRIRKLKRGRVQTFESDFDRISLPSTTRRKAATDRDSHTKKLKIKSKRAKRRISLCGTSGYDYNCITNTLIDRKNVDQRKLIKKKPWLIRRKHEISKFSEMGGLACPKYNPEFAKQLKRNPRLFYNKPGMCETLNNLKNSYIQPFRAEANNFKSIKTIFLPSGRNYGNTIQEIPGNYGKFFKKR